MTSFGPSFVDQAGGDFHLKSSSPLIDIGRTAGVFVPSPWDLDLNDRVVDGKPGGGALPDLGAYEWHQPRQTIARAGTATPGFRTR